MTHPAFRELKDDLERHFYEVRIFENLLELFLWLSITLQAEIESYLALRVFYFELIA